MPGMVRGVPSTPQEGVEREFVELDPMIRGSGQIFLLSWLIVDSNPSILIAIDPRIIQRTVLLLHGGKKKDEALAFPTTRSHVPR